MRPSRPMLAALPLAVAALLLAGCTPESPEPSPSPSGSATATESPDPSETPTPEPTPGPAVDADCETLIPAQTIYDFNSQYLLLPEASGTEEQTTAVDAGGVACTWQNGSSSATIELAVAGYTAESLAAQRTLDEETGEATDLFSPDGGVFSPGESGTAYAYIGAYRIVLNSVEFSEPGDPAPLLTAAVGALG